MNTMNAKSKLEVLKEIFGPQEAVSFLGDKALLPRGDYVVEVMLESRISSNEYHGLEVSIVHKQNGKITSNYFSFEQYLGEKANRTHSNTKDIKNMHLWSDNGKFYWYIVFPTSTKPIVNAIFQYAFQYAAVYGK
jgi:hypothetical protein